MGGVVTAACTKRMVEVSPSFQIGILAVSSVCRYPRPLLPSESERAASTGFSLQSVVTTTPKQCTEYSWSGKYDENHQPLLPETPPNPLRTPSLLPTSSDVSSNPCPVLQAWSRITSSYSKCCEIMVASQTPLSRRLLNITAGAPADSLGEANLVADEAVPACSDVPTRLRMLWSEETAVTEQ